MSTIKATYLQHPSASSPNLTLASDGSVSGGAGLGGLVHVHTENFSSISSVSIDNCFSDSYENYFISLTATSTNSTSSADIRLRSGGTDDSSTSYNWEYLAATSTTVSAGNTNQAQYTVLSMGTTKAATSCIIFGPKLSDRTIFTSNQFSRTVPSVAFTYCQHTVSSPYDGMTLSCSAGTMTGSLRIYGYANS